MKGKPNEAVYRLKKEVLGRFEQLSSEGWLDLYYGDEAGVNLEPNVPYGWQFADEEVSMPSEKGKGINCFGLFTRDNQSWVAVSEATINGAFVVEQLDRFSFSLRKLTIVVLDNARIHQGNRMRERIEAWQRRGLYIFYLPTYSPHLNIAETVWRRVEIRMARRGRLYFQRASEICRQAGIMGIWKEFENKVFKLQNSLN